MKNQNPAWLSDSHPNYIRWKRARDLSVARGKFVKSIINQKVNPENLSVLDLGSGEGGTSKVFSESNFVVSLDLSLVRLQRQQAFVISKGLPKLVEMNDSDISHFDPDLSGEKSDSLNVEDFSVESAAADFEMTLTNQTKYFALVNGSALKLPFANHSFGLIIIQDVVEHLTDISKFYSEVKRVLKTDGSIYLSTPNKYSIFNIFSDPHFGLPFVSILNRKSIKRYFLKYLRKDDFHRTDIAQLFSLNELLNLVQKDYETSLYTKFSVKELFNGNKGIVWSKFHLILIGLCKFIKLDWVLIKIANDSFGIINKYFAPTFYMILRTR